MMDELMLRPWNRSDAAALQRAYLSTPDLSLQLGGSDLAAADAARDFIDNVLVFDDSRKNWAIVEEGVAVGNVGLSAIERMHDTAWSYYWLARSARGRGHATRALASASEWAFDAGIFRLELGHRRNNPSSCAVATRAGFTAEGIERQKLRYGAERFDVELHARLATDPAPAIDRIRIDHWRAQT